MASLESTSVASARSDTISDELLAAALESLSLGANIVDRDGTVLYANEAQARILGVSARQLVGQTVAVHLNLPVENCSNELAAFMARADTGEVMHEFMARRTDGTQFSSRVWVHRVKAPFDHYFAFMQRDITRETSVEEELVRTREELRDFVESARIGLHWVGPDGTILWANKAELEMLGYSASEYFGRSITEFHADAPVIEDILRRLTCDETLCDYPARLIRKDGTIREVIIDSSVYRRDGEFIHTRCFTRDVTEQREAEKNLRSTLEQLEHARDAALDASRTKSQFLANMSHELRTPLNIIIGYAEMLLDDEKLAGSNEKAGDLAKIVNAGKHLQAVIGDIHDLSRIEAGKLEIAVQTVDVLQTVRDAVQLAEPLARLNGNKVSMALCDAPVFVHADETRLRQVLFNLLSNAAKFTQNGIIHAACRMEYSGQQPLVEVIIKDSGPGISHEQQEKLFQPFVQADTGRHHGSGGTGLGLAISKRLTELMGGVIGVHSEPGAGAEFYVHFPAAAATPHDQ
jgi:PAS domain S-box-containing protein